MGLINAYQISAQPRFLAAALKSWDDIEAHLVDRVHGEWFRYVSRAGVASADEPKVSFCKCPYHNGRACLEMIERLERIRDQLQGCCKVP